MTFQYTLAKIYMRTRIYIYIYILVNKGETMIGIDRCFPKKIRKTNNVINLEWLMLVLDMAP